MHLFIYLPIYLFMYGLVMLLPMFFLLVLSILLLKTIYFILFTGNNCRFMNISIENVYDFI